MGDFGISWHRRMRNFLEALRQYFYSTWLVVLLVCVRQIAKLSFAMDDEEESGEEEANSDTSDDDDDEAPKVKMVKNPDVDTSFLPDRVREEEENRLREELRQVSFIVGLFPYSVQLYILAVINIYSYQEQT